MSYKDDEEFSGVDIGDEEEVEIDELISDDDIDSPLEEEEVLDDDLTEEDEEEFASIDGSEY